MKRTQVGMLVAALSGAALIWGCGGGAPPVDSPDEAMPDEAMPAEEAMPDSPSEEMAEDAAPTGGGDGIIRDADGDGEADDANTGCEGLTKTKCQITSGCAWSSDDTCVEATGSMM